MKAGEFVMLVIESAINFVAYPIIAVLDWIAKQWLSREIKERESFIEFLETALSEQRLSITNYIIENRKLSDRLKEFENNGVTVSLKHQKWLESEAVRLTAESRAIRIQSEAYSEKLSKVVDAGNRLADIVYPASKKRLSKKDNEVIKAIKEWNDII